MDFRIITLLIGGGAFAVGIAALVAAQCYPRLVARPLIMFGLGKLAIAVSMALISLRGTLPDFLTIVVANSLIIVNSYIGYAAVRDLQGKDWSPRLGIAAVLAVLAGTLWFIYAQPDLRGVRAVVGLTTMILTAVLAVELLWRYQGRGAAHLVSGWAMAVLVVAMLARAINATLEPYLALSLLTVDQFEVAFMSIIFVVSNMNSVNFVLLCGDTFNAELQRLADSDPLTGIANRRRFCERADEELRRARRFRDPLALLIIDVDHFKQVNDTWGHEIGDAVLRGMVDAIVAALRDVDIVGRLGGEEFAVLLPKTDVRAAFGVAERLRAAATSVAVVPNLRITASIGLTVACDGDDFTTLFNRADQAMYQAKQTGRDRVCGKLPRSE